MDFDHMSREDLVAKLKEVIKNRAYTYEDQMKLSILDKSPFTIWASDRNCKITLWLGQSESLYGYSKEDALGKDYVDLFVAEDEKAAARADQISIIDEGAVFHNIANDIAKAGNTLQLLTNCFRVEDIKTGDYWNAEIGLIIDFYEQEKERLKKIISESRKVKAFTDQFISNTQQCRDHFLTRKNTIRSAINDGERRAVQQGKRMAFRDAVKPVIESLDTLQQKLDDLIKKYFEKMQDCAESGSCQDYKTEFDHSYADLVMGFDEISLDFEEINLDFNGDNTIFHLKEHITKENSLQCINLSNLAFEKLNRINDSIEDYQSLTPDPDLNSEHYRKLIQQRDEIIKIRVQIKELTDNIILNTGSSNDFQMLQNIRANMLEKFSAIENRLSTELSI